MEEYIKENALYRYREGSGWCKHGIVYTIKDVKGQMWAVDTYWASSFPRRINQDLIYYAVADVAEDLEFIMMLEEAVEVDKNDFWLYDEKDRLFIPTGGWHERHLIKKTAKKKVEAVKEHVEDLITEKIKKIESISNELDKLRVWKNGLVANPDIAEYYSAAWLWDLEYALTRNIGK